MLVIEGYGRKSLRVADYINLMEDQKILIITCDYKAFEFFISDKNEVYLTEFTNKDDIIKVLKLNECNFKHVIFYQNTKKEDIDFYKDLEIKYNLKAVLTIQSHASALPREIKEYHV